jgi:hypothetical protein
MRSKTILVNLVQYSSVFLTTKIPSSSSPAEETPTSSGQQQHIAEQSNKKEGNNRRFRRTKQKMEYELDEIFRRLCIGESDFQIMTTLNLQERNYYKYKKRLEARLMEYQIRKTDNTLFLECHLFKNRMLKLYKALETKMLDSKTSGVEIARCADVAASIAHNVLKLESEGIRAVKELGLSAEKAAAAVAKKNTFKNLRNSNNNGDDDDGPDNNISPAADGYNLQMEEDEDRKF